MYVCMCAGSRVLAMNGPFIHRPVASSALYPSFFLSLSLPSSLYQYLIISQHRILPKPHPCKLSFKYDFALPLPSNILGRSSRPHPDSPQAILVIFTCMVVSRFAIQLVKRILSPFTFILFYVCYWVTKILSYVCHWVTEILKGGLKVERNIFSCEK